MGKTSLFIVFLGISLSAAFLACSKSNSGSSGSGCAPSTSPIKGPAVGASGNNSDNPFRALAVDPTDPQVIYVGSEGNGLFKSTDGGANWTWLRTGLSHCDAYPEIYSISINPSDANHIAIATNAGPGPVTSGITSTAGFYVSTDAGQSWTQFNSGLSNADTNSVLILSASKYILGLGAGASTNQGDSSFYNGGIFTKGSSGSWSEATTPASSHESIYWQVLKRTSGLIAFGGNPITGTGSGTGILTSSNNGDSWTQVGNPLSGIAGGYFDASDDLQTIYACKRSGETSPLFYKSTDGGANWTNPSTVGNSSSGPVKIVGASPLVALAAIGTVLVRTTDGFATVSTVLTTASSSNEIMAIETAPSNSNYVYVTTKGLLVYRSTDAGLTFTLRGNIRTFIDSN